MKSQKEILISELNTKRIELACAMASTDKERKERANKLIVEMELLIKKIKDLL